MICITINKAFNTGLDIRGSNSNIFEDQIHHQEDFKHCNFQGCYGGVGVFYFEHHTYNYSDNNERALILLNLKMKTIILGGREYDLTKLPSMLQLGC